jgi:hypothetical protein
VKKFLVMLLLGVTVYLNQNSFITWGNVLKGFGPPGKVYLIDPTYNAYGIEGKSQTTGKKTFIPWNSIAWTVED